MKQWKDMLLMAVIAGALILPPLSNSGYSPITMEYLVGVLLAMLIGALLGQFVQYRVAGAGILSVFASLITAFYFTVPLGTALYSLIACMIVGATVAATALRMPGKISMLVGMVALSQSLTAAALSTTAPVIHGEAEPPSNSPAPIVHLLLDEHAGIAAIPVTAVSQRRIDALVKSYVDRGFIVFTHAYSTRLETTSSISQLFNPLEEFTPKMLVRTPSGRSIKLKRAEQLEEVSSTRALDLTFPRYIDIKPAVAGLPHTRTATYDDALVSQALEGYDLSFLMRLNIAWPLAIDWVYGGARAPIVRYLMQETFTGKRLDWKISVKKRIWPLSSRYMMQVFARRMKDEMNRGTYYFGHFIIPHYPYMLSSDCSLKPPGAWTSHRATPARGAKGRIAMRERLYSEHVSQAECAQKEVMNILDAIQTRPEMSDTVMIVHSDHGARIPLKDGDADWYDRKTLDRDMRAAFMAVRIPGKRGRVIDQPVRIDKLYRQLAENDFRKFDLHRIPPDRSNPY